MRHSLLVHAVLGLALAAPSAYAQQTPPDSVTARVVQTLKSDLRSYITMQESYYAGHRTYASAASQTQLRPSRGVTLVVLYAGDTGHSAVAIHGDRPDVVCAIWVGRDPRPPLYDGATEAVPTCHGS
jgi:hypothetical protein